MELLILITALVSCGAFCLVMVTLLMVLHKNDLCCSYTQRSDDYWEEAVQNSFHSLISHFSTTALGTPVTQPSREVFVVGKPSHYHLCDPPPRLPSYDTVRREDRQNHAHCPIAQRPDALPPPSYEESVWLSPDRATVDVHPLDTAMTANIHQTRLHDSHAALE